LQRTRAGPRRCHNVRLLSCVTIRSGDDEVNALIARCPGRWALARAAAAWNRTVGRGELRTQIRARGSPGFAGPWAPAKKGSVSSRGSREAEEAGRKEAAAY